MAHKREYKEDGGCGYFKWVDDDILLIIGEEKFNLIYKLHKAEESLEEVRSLFLEAEASRDWFKDQMREAQTERTQVKKEVKAAEMERDQAKKN
ncbi:uncharacterized protein LOC132619061 isoform X2 [Lycium barbarum]|uniref:uncharacterized protein LOC132619061 isoform X2 n=1 Tax=Lycium barbarum TaxID=112863 RepID=UPI00293F0D1B|nr:uncharacterized protein LOC132619061 isoform X2 [Lycium barbarum]